MRPGVLNPLFCSLACVDGIGEHLSKRLAALVGGDLLVRALFHLPVDIRHRPVLTSGADVVHGTYGTFLMRVVSLAAPQTRRQPFKVTGIFDDTPVEVVFFHYHKAYLQQRFRPGTNIVLSGRLELSGGIIRVLHPDYCVSGIEFVPVFEPLYPLTAGVSLKTVRKMTLEALKRLPELPEWQDTAFLKAKGFAGFKESLEKLHHPCSTADAAEFERHRRRLAYDELLANQLALRLMRGHRRQSGGITVHPTEQLTTALEKSLPFSLTKAQKRVIAEIRADLNSGQRMSRLLQGDVGSGKTLVALMSLLAVVEAGYQGAFMAPTDILARQHFETCLRYAKGLNVKIALLTGRDKGERRARILKALATGETDILIGTHALITDDVDFKNLALAVIDEQHKFGVNQRLSLSMKQAGAHVLSMTATPIPRTLALTAYGDMDLSVLDEKPAGRQAVETRVMPCTRIPELISKLKQLIAGQNRRRQVYWICPLVEESEKSDLMAAEKRFASLQKVFGDRVALVHGQMKGPEKDAVMARFAAGETDILVATTVIEVGVDVKTADIMVIEHAERFGLSGLHQLRGRIGRGHEKAVCLLLHGARLSQTARRRLEIMRETADGFLIAEEDLKLRGSGDVLGARQSGLPVFQMADLEKDRDLLLTAAKDAGLICSQDPELASDRGQALKNLLYLFQKDAGIRALKAG